MAQLRKRKITEESPAYLVLPILQQLASPPWCAPDAWAYMQQSMAHWTTAHGSLAVFRAARTMKPLPLQRWLEQRRKQTERTDEAKYLFVDMNAIGDAE